MRIHSKVETFSIPGIVLNPWNRTESLESFSIQGIVLNPRNRSQSKESFSSRGFVLNRRERFFHSFSLVFFFEKNRKEGWLKRMQMLGQMTLKRETSAKQFAFFI